MSIKVQYSSSFKKLNSLVTSFPELKVRVLSMIAKEGRLLLRNQFLSGQYIKYKKGEKDRRGVYLVSGRVGRRSSIAFASYPMNLFERGRRLRGGGKEPGKYVITRHFKGALNANLQNFVNKADKEILQKEFKKV